MPESLLPPRFAPAPFQKVETPALLQKVLERELAGMSFHPQELKLEMDNEFNAVVHGGISGQGLPSPNLAFAPMSAGLHALSYAMIGPLIETWSGCELERSWGYGIRSYGPGSVLHLHRDRVHTHVISCIIHGEDCSQSPWPLDFIDHEGRHHQLLLEPGTTLFYESLCPHGRLTPFEGSYYRNLYFHWRPKGWDPAPYKKMRCKYPSLEACMRDITLARSGKR